MHFDGFFLFPSVAVAHEHLKERGLFGLAAPGTNPSDYYHQMTLMASHPAPYGDLLMQSGGAASAPHLHDYLNPVDGEYLKVGHGGELVQGEGNQLPRSPSSLHRTPVLSMLPDALWSPKEWNVLT